MLEFSRLESLPAELIQRIFILSHNIDLPLASPTLTRALSCDSVYRKLIKRWFFDSRCLRFLDREDAKDSFSDLRELAQLQGRLLSCRWMTYALVDDVIRQGKHDQDVDAASHVMGCPYAFPTRLLHGPRTSDKLQLCQWARNTGTWEAMERACRDSQYECDKCDRTTFLSQGIKDAILERDLDVLGFFLGYPQPFEYISKGPLPFPDLIKFSIQQGGFDKTITILVLDAAWDFLDKLGRVWNSDPELELPAREQNIRELATLCYTFTRQSAQAGDQDGADFIQDWWKTRMLNAGEDTGGWFLYPVCTYRHPELAELEDWEDGTKARTWAKIWQQNVDEM